MQLRCDHIVASSVSDKLHLVSAAMAYNPRLLLEEVQDALSSRQRIPISEIARQLKVERHTIERAVRKGTGRTFRQLQLEMLLAEAFRLLAAEPARSVKEVSVLLGCGSPRAFSRFMKHNCGRSPTEARSQPKLTTSVS